MKRIIAACFISFALLFGGITHAADSDKPSKESLLAAWEQIQKANPYTVKFEKTANKNVYAFETTLFPYKGKVHVLNLLIDKHPGEYYEFDNEDAPDNYVGVVEIDLEGIDKNFTGKYYRSYETWARDNTLHYEISSGKWFTPIEWTAHKREARAASRSGACATPQQADKPSGFSVFLSWLPMLIMVGLWLGVSRWSMRKHAKLQDKYTKLAEENQALLSQILEVLKRKA